METDKQVNIELLSQWDCETEFRNLPKIAKLP